MARSTRLILLFALCGTAAVAHPALLCARPGVDGDAHPSGTVNEWFAAPDGSVLTPGTRKISLGKARNGGSLAAGDLVLLVQLQGARIDASNSDAYGDGRAGGRASGWTALQAGHFEFLTVEAAAGNRILVRGQGPSSGIRFRYVSADPVKSGEQGRQRWELVRVPQYQSAALAGNLRAPAWNGHTGGVLALDVRGVLNLAGHTVSVSSDGFRGGAPLNLQGALGAPDDYRYGAPDPTALRAGYGQHASKGEGLAGTPRYLVTDGQVFDSRLSLKGDSDGYPGGSMARGAPGNAGGGGNSLDLDNKRNAGGGGGGGGAAGDNGRDAAGKPRGGEGGAGVPADQTLLVFGGGGGAGSRRTGKGLAGAGGPGGGVLLIRAGRIRGPGVLDASGGAARPGRQAGGGGGGAGTILLLAPFADHEHKLQIRLSGGPGGSAPAPGGHGGAGRLLVGGGMTPPDVKADVASWDRLRPGMITGTAAGWQCRPSGTLITGYLFNDNGHGGGKPQDGWQQSGEAGLAGVPMRVTRDDGSVVASTVSNRGGHFALELPASLAGQSLTLKARLPDGWMPDAASDDPLPLAPLRYAGNASWHFTMRPQVQYDGLRLGLIRAPQWQVPKKRTIEPGTTQLFAFRYLAHTPSKVRFRYQGDLQQGAHWKHVFLLDDNCDNASEYVDHNVTRWVKALPGQPVCARVRVEVPENATAGALRMEITAETDIGDSPLSLKVPPLKTSIRARLKP